MARRNYLVEGLSGAGKSSVYDELIRRGFAAVSTDRAWKRPPAPGSGPHSTWDEERAVGELERTGPEVLFVCGSSGNRDRFLPYFTKVFDLRIDDDTMRRRLRKRTNNDFGKQPDELELMLALNRSGAAPAGAIAIDATRPLDEVVEELLGLADCPSVASDTERPPWSRRGRATGRSFVLPREQIEGMPVDGRGSGTHLEYAWSGDLLMTLLTYLGEQGIDLVALTGSQADERTMVVLTAHHRERYLARLDPSAFDGAVLRRYYEVRHETAADGVGYAMLDGIAFLRDTLAALDAATVAVLVIE